MTDSDSYFSPRNHPQRFVYLPEDSEPSDPELSGSEMGPGENTPLFSDPEPTPPSHSYAPVPHTNYETPGKMGNSDFGNSFNAAPPYNDQANMPHICAENCACGARPRGPQENPVWWGQSWSCPEIMGGAWRGSGGSGNGYSVSGIAKWLFTRISFVVLAYFLLREVVDVYVHIYGEPGRGPPPGRKGPDFFQFFGSNNGHFVEKRRFTFSDPASFYFTQMSTQTFGSWDRGHVQVLGGVFVKGVEDEEDVVVDFEFRLSEEDLKNRLIVETTNDRIILKTDRTPYNDRRSCIEVQATISIPLSKPAFDNFSIRTESLNIALEPSLDLEVNNLSLSAISGSVTMREAYGVDSQTTVTTIDSGDITGDFGLFNLVHLETKAGSISANVIPQDSSNHKAEYIARTISGFIKTTFPKDTNSLPRGRTYWSKIDTVSGSIRGDYLLGESLSLNTMSGSISQISITATGDERPALITDTKQGSINLSFMNNLGNGSKGLNAKHTSISGSVRVEYPEDWEGVVSGRSMSGSVDISGRGVVIVEDTKWPAGRFVKGMKGAGNHGGSIECSAVSGSIHIHVGSI